VQGVKHLPSLYGYLYQKTRSDSKLSFLLKRFRQASLQRLLELIQEEKPTVLVSTFPPASAAISLLKAKQMTELMAVTVITDHSDHSYWLHPYTDLYLVGSQEVKTALQQKMVPGSKVVVTGIPIRPSYSMLHNKEELRSKFGIASSSFVVLVMGGGFGMIDDEFVEQLQSNRFPPNVQFVFICGRNAGLLQRMSEIFQGSRHVILKGFVDAVHEWMAIADVLITKPGGLTVSEALAVQLPMVLIEPRPGQERDNADYLTHKGVAALCKASELPDQLEQLIHHPMRLREMRDRAGSCRRQHSAFHAVMEILNLMSPAAAAVRTG